MTRRVKFLLLSILVLAFGCQSSHENPTHAFVMVTTADQSQLLSINDLEVTSATAKDLPVIEVDTNQSFQSIDGFGYTLTGGSALHIHNMSDDARSALLNELFSTDEGSIGVSFLRLSIGASDLDAAPFSYNDLPEGETDEPLAQFDLGPDKEHLIPLLKEILAINPRLKLMGSPWSPPVWMKDNGDTRSGSLLPAYYGVYAQYLVKYIEGMAEEGIPIWGITIQNEPLHPGNNPSLLMLAADQATFIKDHLGPAFRDAGIETKIIIYDHNADRPDYPISILNDPEANQFIDGSAFHLYGGEIEALTTVHEAHPDKHLYFTEQWIGAPANFAGDFRWHVRELIIGATRNWSKVVLEWNLAADPNQDPHTDRGGCDRCLGALTIDGDQVERNPAYYIIAHASKYVSQGSVRVSSNSPETLPNVAFKTPEGKIVMIVLNDGDQASQLAIKLGDSLVEHELTAGAAGTYVFQK
ncbi:MAG TPA: glycoside hydrolase family 30 beta sandwich domain-containing protein [Roseivirga sp.]